MITESDLTQAIAECQGQRNPTANTCIKLAAFLTIRRELFGEEKDVEPLAYSYSPAPDDSIRLNSDSEFSRLVNGKSQDEVMPLLDEMMDTIKVIQPRLYNLVLDKLR